MSPLKCLWMMTSWPLSPAPHVITSTSVTNIVIVYPCLHLSLVTLLSCPGHWGLESVMWPHLTAGRSKQLLRAQSRPGPELPGHWPARHRSEKIFVRIEPAERSKWAPGLWDVRKKCLNIMAAVHKYGFRIPISSEQYPSWLLNFPVTAELGSSDATLSKTKDSCQIQHSQMWWTRVLVRVWRWYLASITIAIPIHTRH